VLRLYINQDEANHFLSYNSGHYTKVVWKVLGLTVKKRIYNFKIIFIFQHNLP